MQPQSPDSLASWAASAGVARAGKRGPQWGCCRLLDHLVDTDSMAQLISMADDPDPRVRTAAFHALACARCKGDTSAPGAGQVLEPALQHMATDPDAHVRAMAAELVGKFVHTDGRAVTALETARALDPSPTVRKKAGWFTPGGTIYKRTVPRVPRLLRVHVVGN